MPLFFIYKEMTDFCKLVYPSNSPYATKFFVLMPGIDIYKIIVIGKRDGMASYPGLFGEK